MVIQNPTPEEQRSWKYTYACLCLIVCLNVGILIACRILLDAVNEFDEPIIDGNTRYWLETFLFYFSMSICFCCCGCCCCAGDCCVWISNCFNSCNNYCYNAVIKSTRQSSAEAFRQQQEAIDNANLCRSSRILYNQQVQQAVIERPTTLVPPISRMSNGQQRNLQFNVNPVQIV